MRITHVRYSRLVSGPNFSNESVGVEIEVLPGDIPDNAMHEARRFVAAQLSGKHSVVSDDEIEKRVNEAKNDMARKLNDLAAQIDPMPF